jgi:hypothetical protein
MSLSFEELTKLCEQTEVSSHSWTQEINYEGQIVTDGFLFPVEHDLNFIRNTLMLSGVFVRSESQRVILTLSESQETRVVLKCSHSYRKRPDAKRVRKTNSMTVSSPDKDCSFKLSLKKVNSNPWMVVSLNSQHTNHHEPDYMEGFIHHINLLTEQQLQLFVSYFRANTQVSSIRNIFSDMNLHVTTQFVRNLRRKIWPEVDYVSSSTARVPRGLGDSSQHASLSQGMRHLIDLQANNCLFIV